MRAHALGLLGLVLAGCSGHVMSPQPTTMRFGAGSGEPRAIAPPRASSAPSALAAGRVAAPSARKEASAAEIALADLGATLVKVAQMRGLSVLRPVEGKVLDRDAVLARVMSKAERDVPPGVLRAQGELLAAFGLVPPDYDYEAGMYGLLKNNVAGFYDPDDGAMVLLDDLDEQNIRDTLAHELDHALQDQHYHLDPLLRYRPHDSDRVAAVQVLSEGDATSAMFDVVAGGAAEMPESLMRLMLLGSTTLSPGGSDVPRVLHLALVAPYVDGLAVVQELRRHGDWAAVDELWRRLPTTTEQVLHLDKYLANEPAIEVPAPPLDALGPDWRALDHDVLGEQGLRISLEKWVDRDTAAQVAAGWGGDRYVVAERPLAPSPSALLVGGAAAPAGPAQSPAAAAPKAPAGPAELAVAWVIRFDTQADARELGAVLRQAFGNGCSERPLLGALSWLLGGDAVVIAAGPFARDAKGARQPTPPSCRRTTAWARSMLLAASNSAGMPAAARQRE